jgi:hypothetical protein
MRVEDEEMEGMYDDDDGSVGYEYPDDDFTEHFKVQEKAEEEAKGKRKRESAWAWCRNGVKVGEWSGR